MAATDARIAARDSTAALGRPVDPEVVITTAASGSDHRLVRAEHGQGAPALHRIGGQRRDDRATVQRRSQRRPASLGRTDSAQPPVACHGPG